MRRKRTDLPRENWVRSAKIRPADFFRLSETIANCSIAACDSASYIHQQRDNDSLPDALAWQSSNRRVFENISPAQVLHNALIDR